MLHGSGALKTANLQAHSSAVTDSTLQRTAVICCMTPVVRRKQQIYKFTALWTDTSKPNVYGPQHSAVRYHDAQEDALSVRRGTDCQRTPKKERGKKESVALCAMTTIHCCLKRCYHAKFA